MRVDSYAPMGATSWKQKQYESAHLCPLVVATPLSAAVSAHCMFPTVCLHAVPNTPPTHPTPRLGTLRTLLLLFLLSRRRRKSCQVLGHVCLLSQWGACRGVVEALRGGKMWAGWQTCVPLCNRLWSYPTNMHPSLPGHPSSNRSALHVHPHMLVMTAT